MKRSAYIRRIKSKGNAFAKEGTKWLGVPGKPCSRYVGYVLFFCSFAIGSASPVVSRDGNRQRTRSITTGPRDSADLCRELRECYGGLVSLRVNTRRAMVVAYILHGDSPARVLYLVREHVPRLPLNAYVYAIARI